MQRNVLFVFATAVLLHQALVIAHSCIHDELIKREGHLMKKVVPQNYGETTLDYKTGRKLLQTTPQPIRIHVDTSYLTTDSPYTCYKAGQQFQNGDPSVTGGATCSSSVTANCYGTCTQDDVLTQTKMDYLVGTVIPAAIGWLTNALSVTPVVGNLVLSSGSCGFNGGVPVPSSYVSPGRANTGTFYMCYQCRS